MTYTILNYLWFFIIYAFLGWCVEVAFHVVTSKKFVNRGFLNGPVCPIYGFGMVILVFSLSSLVDNLLLLFIGSVVLTSILEFITGFVLEKVFNDKWWDYSELPFNIKGYICLSFSIVWGLAAVFMLHIIHPRIYKFISIFNNTFGNVILVSLLVFLFIDFVVTVSEIMKIKKRIAVLDYIAEKLKVYSDSIGNNIYKGMSATIKTKDIVTHKIEDSTSDIKVSLDERKKHFSELKAKYEKILSSEKSFVHKRLEKAFPNLKQKLTHSRGKDSMDK